MRLRINGGWWQFTPVLRDRVPFKTGGALFGIAGPGETFGRLPHQYWQSNAHADYTVMSYATPLAWHVPGEGWTMPEVKYSVTTSKHQGRIRVALAEIMRAESEATTAEIIALLDTNPWHAA